MSASLEGLWSFSNNQSSGVSARLIVSERTLKTTNTFAGHLVVLKHSFYPPYPFVSNFYRSWYERVLSRHQKKRPGKSLTLRKFLVRCGRILLTFSYFSFGVLTLYW